MTEEIFEMIMKEARSRKGQALEQAILEVLLEVIAKVFDAIQPLQVDNIKSTRVKFTRIDP